jgi:hypothetical protein
MAMRQVLEPWIVEAISELGGSGSIVDVCTRVWEMHEIDLKSSGELFYTWQYDIRWVADRLRRRRILKAAGACRRSYWELEATIRANHAGHTESVEGNSQISGGRRLT